MDSKAEIRAFLTSRRARITPEQVGLPSYGNRRVPGLRRHEVATLAGVSVEYYTRLERGNVAGVSDSVLDALAMALRFDETERAHLFDLARATTAAGRRRPPRPQPSSVRPGVARMVDSIVILPAIVTNHRFDILLTNPLGRALYSEVFDDRACGANTARFVFLSPAGRRFYRDWEQVALTAVGALRVETAKTPCDRYLSNLIGELSTRSDAFRHMWGSHEVRTFRDGTKRFNHRVVGDISLDHDAMVLAGDDQISVAVYSAAPGSADEDALRLLASWSATEQATRTGTGPQS